ncbi:MAG: cobalamin biosynthesis protein CobW [Alphaproteobacteria bacterium]
MADRFQKIPTTIVTGFLGAGKTTLIRHLITHANGTRIALIINEFGDVGVDGEVLKACGSPACAEGDIVELANGCICCTVADDFIPTMAALIERDNPPDHIVIETSGLALPQPLIDAFNWPSIRTCVTVDGVVTVVDGLAQAGGTIAQNSQALDDQRRADDALDHESPIEELFEDQLAAADILVLSKADLLDAEGLKNARANLSAACGRAVPIVEAHAGAVPLAVMVGRRAGAETDLANRTGHHVLGEEHEHDDFDSCVITLGEQDDLQAFLARATAAIEANQLLRLKGFIAVAGKSRRLVVQAVGPRLQTYYDRPWESGEQRQGQLVAIGLAGLQELKIRQDLAP